MHVTERYVSWMNDYEVVQYTESRFYSHTIESIAQYVKQTSLKDDVYFFAIHTPENGHIGNIKLGPVNRYHSYAEIGIIIGEKSCWGKGYGTEAVRALKDWAFVELKLHKVVAGAYASNTGSVKAFAKCGFELEGILKSHVLFEGIYEDCYRMGCVNKIAT